MKLQVMSDLHLEFDHTIRPKQTDADILILSGDICVADYFTRSAASPYAVKAQEFRRFFYEVSQMYDRVIYVAGNHEHYHGYIDKTIGILKENIGDWAHVLNNDYVDIDGWRFIGSTLWTDMNKGSPLTEMYLRNAMNDFRLIQHSGSHYKFRPFDAAQIHEFSKQAIDLYSKDQHRVVVCTHHAPSFKSIHPKYHNDTDMNGGYYSDLDEFIMDRPQIKLWTHGHVHSCFDYEIGTTRVVCNPHGYGSENPYFKYEEVISL